MQFWKDNFDKALLAAMYIALAAMAMMLSLHGGMDENTLDWARAAGVLVLGALLREISGSSNANPPQPPQGGNQ